MEKRSFILAVGISFVTLWMGNAFYAQEAVAPEYNPRPGKVDGRKAPLWEHETGGVLEVTAYNVGVREQTSETPCIGAIGQDLCQKVAQGEKICAANFVALGTILSIEGYGECVVLDRMHKRFPYRVDIAMREDEIAEALEFGLQRRFVEVL